jgi:hypothetical protein
VYKRNRKNLKGKLNLSGKNDTQGSRFQVLADETEGQHTVNGQTEAAGTSSSLGKIWKKVQDKSTGKKKQDGIESDRQQEKNSVPMANSKTKAKGKTIAGSPIPSTMSSLQAGTNTDPDPKLLIRTLKKPVRQRKALKEITNGVAVKTFAIPSTDPSLTTFLKKPDPYVKSLLLPNVTESSSSLVTSMVHNEIGEEIRDASFGITDVIMETESTTPVEDVSNENMSEVASSLGEAMVTYC